MHIFNLNMRAQDYPTGFKIYDFGVWNSGKNSAKL